MLHLLLLVLLLPLLLLRRRRRGDGEDDRRSADKGGERRQRLWRRRLLQLLMGLPTWRPLDDGNLIRHVTIAQLSAQGCLTDLLRPLPDFRERQEGGQRTGQLRWPSPPHPRGAGRGACPRSPSPLSSLARPPPEA